MGDVSTELCWARHDRWRGSAFTLIELWTLNWYPGYATWGFWTKAGGVKPEG